MSEFLDKEQEYAIGVETTRGSAIAPTYSLGTADSSFSEVVEYAENTQRMGNLADSDGADIVNKYVKGTIGNKIQLKSFGAILKATLGEIATTTVETGVYSHKAVISQTNAHPTLSIHKKNPLEQLVSSNCVPHALKISADTKDYVQFSIDFLGKKAETSAENFPPYTKEEEFLGKDITVKIADDVAGLAGAPEVEIRNFEFSYEQKAIPKNVLGDVSIKNVFSGETKVDLNLELYFDSLTIKNWYRNGDKKAIEIKIENADKTIGGSSHPSVKIMLPLVSFQDWDGEGTDDDIVLQNTKARGHFSIDNGNQLEITLVNTVDSY